ncbi:MAG: hypothetical protein AABY22_27455 [Nanoarchaeota archaeon]
MKKIYSFELNKDVEVETQVETKNDSGEIVITKKKEKQSVPHKFFVARPTRSQSDAAQLYNSVQVSQSLRLGMLSVYSLDKKYREEGVFTEEDNKRYKELYDVLIKAIEELQVINNVAEAERTEDQKKRWGEITEEMSQTRLKLKDYENLKSSLYTHSAEYRARNMTITWWVLNLSHKEENGKEVPFFTGKTLEDKFKYYDELVDQDDSFTKSVIEKFMYVISFWIVNGSDKPEDFEQLEKFMASDKKENLVV